VILHRFLDSGKKSQAGWVGLNDAWFHASFSALLVAASELLQCPSMTNSWLQNDFEAFKTQVIS